MLVGQEWLIKQIHLTGKPKNTLVAVGGLYIGVLHISEEFSLILDSTVNKQGIKVHRFCFGDQQLIEFSDVVEWNRIKSVIQICFADAGCTHEYTNEVIQSFTSVLFDSLLQFQQDEYLKQLMVWHPHDNLEATTEVEEDQLLNTLTKQPS